MTIFEEIKLSKNVLFRDKDLFIVLDIDPISKGHILILPQLPYIDIDEIPERLLLKIFKSAQVYIRLAKVKFKAIGYSIMQNGGEFNDLGVFHLHVIPRQKENDFGYIKKERSQSIDVNQLRRWMKKEIENER